MQRFKNTTGMSTWISGKYLGFDTSPPPLGKIVATPLNLIIWIQNRSSQFSKHVRLFTIYVKNVMFFITFLQYMYRTSYATEHFNVTKYVECEYGWINMWLVDRPYRNTSICLTTTFTPTFLKFHQTWTLVIKLLSRKTVFSDNFRKTLRWWLKMENIDLLDLLTLVRATIWCQDYQVNNFCIIQVVNILCAPIVDKDFKFTDRLHLCNCNCLFSGKTEPQLATHVLQFVFFSDSGFRFPIAQFPSAECTPSDLYFNV